ncbi:MAG: DUF433 domain-containing protein [Planctomycetes bacterium]|nr:DUF433 domain-containing protein [Planctomycetota bacterium]
MNWRDHVTVSPAVCHGAPCFKGTRVMVSVVLDNLAAGRSAQHILRDYPSLAPEAIPAAIDYAAELARERIVGMPGSHAA